MSQIPNISTHNIQQPFYNQQNAQTVQTPQGQTVSVSPNTHQIYQYPQTSLYDTSKQATSGVNIYIYNPSGIGGPSANTTYTTQPQQAPMAQQPIMPMQQSQPVASAPISENPVASTTINNSNTLNNKENQKTKLVTELTDDYIKTLESFLRSPDAKVRKAGITELIKRYEEDLSRYNDPALTALLNIALQDTDASNQIAAMSPIASGSANGDADTVKLLNQLVASEEMHGTVASMAKDALLNANQTKIAVPDDSK